MFQMQHRCKILRPIYKIMSLDSVEIVKKKKKKKKKKINKTIAETLPEYAFLPLPSFSFLLLPVFSLPQSQISY